MKEMKNCNNCMRQPYCGGGGTKCFDYQSLSQKLKMMHIPTEDWMKLSVEWDKTRKEVRKRLGYDRR